MKNLPVNLESKESIIEFLQKPTVAVAEAITGFLASDKKDLTLMAGKLVQGAIKVNLLSQLGIELKELREKGKIKEDYFATNNQRASLLELLKFIDSETPDEEVFNAVKAIFLKGISKDATSQDELIGYQLLKICKQLGSGEILTMKAVYETYKTEINKSNKTTGVRQWLNEVGEKLDVPSDMIELFENKLVELKLLGDRKHADRSGIEAPETYRLTGLGIKMCEFILDKSNET